MPLVSNLRRIYSSKVTRRHLLPVPSASFRRRRVTGYDDSCHDANVLPIGETQQRFLSRRVFFKSILDSGHSRVTQLRIGRPVLSEIFIEIDWIDKYDFPTILLDYFLNILNAFI